MTVRYAVRPWLVTAFALGSGAAYLLALRTPFPGRLLFVVAGFVAGAEALRALVFRPTLVANARGLDVAVGLRRVRVPWSDVEAVTTLGPPSSGVRARRRADALEIDLGERLLVVSGYRLGAPAALVAEELIDFRNSSG